MKYIKFVLILFFIEFNFSQTYDLNDFSFYEYQRNNQIIEQISDNFSYTIRPINSKFSNSNLNSLFPNILNFGNNYTLKLIPINYKIEYNSTNPYNRNNGNMIPNRGYQHMISFGLHLNLGPLEIQIKPEHIFAENKKYDGFWSGHYDSIWALRYNWWNHIDTPERFGEKRYNKFLNGQSYIKLNFGKLSFGISNENLWWGPSKRNSIMMSNHASGFKHLTFNSNRPINTFFGNFEFQLISARLESSGFLPPDPFREFNGRGLWINKINQLGEDDDWRYYQGLVFTISPKWLNGLHIGVIRWAQMYSALVKGKYDWMVGSPSYFPIFNNIFRKADKSVDYEAQIDQAGGAFFRWIWPESLAEFYGEFHFNDAKYNLRDLLLDSDHSRGVTLGLSKIFKRKNDNSYYAFNWEWTQLEQSGGRLLRDAGSWYLHYNVYEGYTNNGEVIGAGIGPGSNSQYISLSLNKGFEKYGISLEIIDQNNDFYYQAFNSANDYRRYWKDFNLHLDYRKEFKNIFASFKIIYNRSLNYQWELEDYATPYYHPGRDVNNFHVNINLLYKFSNKKINY